jgi:hypothetical protein
MMQGSVAFYAVTAAGISQSVEVGATFDNLYVRHLGAPAPPGIFAATVTGHFADATRAFFEDSPYRYNVAFAQGGKMFDGFRRHITPTDLATVTVRYSGDGPSDFPHTHAVTSAPVGFTPAFGISYPIQLHLGVNDSRTEYFAGDGVRWMQDSSRGNPANAEWEGGEGTPWQQFRAGGAYRLRWGAAVIGPAFFHDEVSVAASRSADTMSVRMPMFSPGIAGFSGASVSTLARTVLSRDGTVIGETAEAGVGNFPVPAAGATYRLDVHALRRQYEFSPTLDASWTFPSASVTAGRVDPLPLMAVRFNPVVNDRNRARAGVVFDLPMWVEWQRAPTGPRTVRLSLAVSYDDGAHWQDSVVKPSHEGWIARLTHPAPGVGTGYVSLRVTASDGAGSSVTQTIVHAYGLTSARGPE